MTMFKMIVLLSDSENWSTPTNLCLHFAVVCFMFVLDQTLAEQLFTVRNAPVASKSRPQPYRALPLPSYSSAAFLQCKTFLRI